MTNRDILKASAIAGGTIGAVSGFMGRGEELESQGVSSSRQVTGSIAHGIITGGIGVGVGLGVSSTAAALRNILRR